MESKRRSERTKAGLQRAISQGKTLGRPKGAKDKKKRRRPGTSPGMLTAKEAIIS
jgi:DNA invertase Pin-like site-specific DNA recombinase